MCFVCVLKRKGAVDTRGRVKFARVRVSPCSAERASIDSRAAPQGKSTYLYTHVKYLFPSKEETKDKET